MYRGTVSQPQILSYADVSAVQATLFVRRGLRALPDPGHRGRAIPLLRPRRPRARAEHTAPRATPLYWRLDRGSEAGPD
jgi:hypothetical protein